MGRIFTAPVTGKAVIVNNPSTTLTTAYTNATGAGAELRAVNINCVQNNGTINTVASGAQEWSIFGSNINVIIGAASNTSYGFGEPYQVQLSDNRVLIFFLPHQQHRGGDTDFMGGTMIHSQILEYQTAGGAKYVAGPIQNHTLPATYFNDMSYSLWSYPSSTYTSSGPGMPCIRAVALSATKVAVAIRQGSSFWLMRFTITGNTVDHTVTSLDITGASAFNTTTAYPFQMDSVPGNPNQVIIAGGGVSNTWKVQSYNVPASGTLSVASTLQDIGGGNGSYYHDIGVSRMVKTATGTTVPYIFAYSTSTTASSAVIYNYDNAASTWTISGTAQSLTGISSQHTGFLCGCLSTGTNVNAVICTTTGSGPSDGLVTFYRQTSSAVASTSRTQLTTQHTTYKRLSEKFQWGDERVVFTGHNGMLVTYDSAGTATNLISPTTDSTNTGRYRPQWFPFNSRPLYSYHDTASRQSNFNVNWIARTGMSSTTNLGIQTKTNNYLPFGHDYGNGYAWNEPAGCWIVCQGGRLYALSTTGVVLSEQQLYNFSPTLNYLYMARQVVCTPTGRILFNADYSLGGDPSTTYSPTTQWNSYNATMYQMVTEPMTVPTQLASIKLQQAPNNCSGHVSCNMVYFTEETSATARTEMAYMLYVYSGATQFYITWFNGTTWQGATYSCGVSMGTGTWGKGFRPNTRMIQDTPCSLAYPRGLWRLVGSYSYDSEANYRYAGYSERYAFGNFGSMSLTQYPTDTTTQVTQGWGISMSTTVGSRSGVMVAAQYEDTLGSMRVWSTINGRLQDPRGWNLPAYGLAGSTNNRWAQIATSKFGYVIAYQNTDRADQTATAYVWDTINSVTQRATVTATSGSGWFTLYQTGKNSIQLFNGTGAGVNNTYTVYGLPDDVRFYLMLDDNAGNTFYLNNGQSLSPVDIYTALFRSETTYQIPNGYSLKLAVDTPNTVQVLLSIQERQ